MKGDLERRALRGPVKAVRAETFRFEDEGGGPVEKFWYAHTAAFDESGRVTEETNENPDGSTGKLVYTYDARGRPSESARYGPDDELVDKSLYAYDARGRLIKESLLTPGGVPVEFKTYTYDADGRKTAEEFIGREFFAPKSGGNGRTEGVEGSEDGPACAVGETEVIFGVEGTDSGFSARGARSVLTLYNDQGKTSELRFLDARRKLIQKVAFTYDAEGRLTGEAQYGVGELTPCEVPTGWKRLLVPLGLRLVRAHLFFKSLSAARKDFGKVARSFTDGPLMSETKYRYEEGGRRVERVTSFCGMLFNRRLTTYDDFGNKAEEVFEDGDASQTSKAFFTREYDGRGNWTRELVASASRWDIEFGTSVPSHVTRRTITYYEDAEAPARDARE